MIVWDASALLCVALNEPGSKHAKKFAADGAMLHVNFAEVLFKLTREGAALDLALSALEGIGLNRLVLDEDIVARSASFSPLARSKGLSLGDRLCLAAGIERGCPILTADKAWADVADPLGVEVVLLR